MFYSFGYKLRRKMDREQLYSFVSLLIDPKETKRQFLLRNCLLNNLEPSFIYQETNEGIHCTLVLGGIFFETTTELQSTKVKAKRLVIAKAADKLMKNYLKIECLQKNKLNTVMVTNKELTVDLMCVEVQNFALNPTLDMISFEIMKDEFRQTLQDIAFRYGFQSYTTLGPGDSIIGPKKTVNIFRPKRDPQQIYLYLLHHGNTNDFYRIICNGVSGNEQQ